MTRLYIEVWQKFVKIFSFLRGPTPPPHPSTHGVTFGVEESTVHPNTTPIGAACHPCKAKILKITRKELNPNACTRPVLVDKTSYIKIISHFLASQWLQYIYFHTDMFIFTDNCTCSLVVIFQYHHLHKPRTISDTSAITILNQC